VIVGAYVRGVSAREVDDLERALGIGHVRVAVRTCTT
jgi:hypothetical protein